MKLPTQEELKGLFNYNPKTGDLTWKVRPANRVKIGDLVRGISSHGYYRVSIKSKTYSVHRIIWCWMTGEDLNEKCIDHKNRCRTNNRWSNLRLATKLENRRNQEDAGYCRRPNGTWRVRIRHLGKALFDKTVKTEEEARALIIEKRAELFGEFAPA